MNGDITYNTNDLQTYDPDTRVGIITNEIEHTKIPEKVAALFAKANTDGSAIATVNYPSKTITIQGAIVGSTQDNLDDRIDDFKAYFNGKDNNLDIDYAGGTRRYIATVNTMSVNRQQKALFAEFTIEFVCTNPFGIDTSATSIESETGYTSALLTAEPTIDGSAPYQLPIITITLNTITGDGDSIQISNDNNGQSMVLYGLGLEDDDVIVIDASTRKVTVNDVEVDYTGTFLELELGDNSISYSDGFDTRDIDIDIDYYKRWL